MQQNGRRRRGRAPASAQASGSSATPAAGSSSASADALAADAAAASAALPSQLYDGVRSRPVLLSGSCEQDDIDCLICCEPIDLADINFKPCPCGFRVRRESGGAALTAKIDRFCWRVGCNAATGSETAQASTEGVVEQRLPSLPHALRRCQHPIHARASSRVRRAIPQHALTSPGSSDCRRSRSSASGSARTWRRSASRTWAPLGSGTSCRRTSRV